MATIAAQYKPNSYINLLTNHKGFNGLMDETKSSMEKKSSFKIKIRNQSGDGHQKLNSLLIERTQCDHLTYS